VSHKNRLKTPQVAIEKCLELYIDPIEVIFVLGLDLSASELFTKFTNPISSTPKVVVQRQMQKKNNNFTAIVEKMCKKSAFCIFF
jgi:hypothetical protein